jgi:carbon monoxide dehydrogenase subunit G
MALELTHHFALTKSAEETFATIQDLERLVPCVDGGEVLEKTGPDSVEAQIEVGAAGMSMTFRGSVEIVEQDPDTHSATVKVTSTETGGQGDANATVEFLLADNEGTINTSVELSGTPMSMGESIPLGILEAMVADFAETLAQS